MASSRELILASFPPLLEMFVQQSENKISSIHFDSPKMQRQSEFLLIKSIKAQNVTHWTRLQRPTKRKHFTLLFALQSFLGKRELSPLRCSYGRLCAAESDAHCWLDKLPKSHRTVLNWYVIYWCWYDLVQKHFGDHSNFWIPCETSKGTDQHCLSGNEIRLKWNICFCDEMFLNIRFNQKGDSWKNAAMENILSLHLNGFGSLSAAGGSLSDRVAAGRRSFTLSQFCCWGLLAD